MIAPGSRVLCRSEHRSGESFDKCLKSLPGRTGRSDDSIARPEQWPARDCLIHHCHFVPVRGPGRPLRGGRGTGVLAAQPFPPYPAGARATRFSHRSAQGRAQTCRTANRRAARPPASSPGARLLAGGRPAAHGCEGARGTAKGRVRWAEDAIWAGLPSRTRAGPRTGAQAGRRTTFQARWAGPGEAAYRKDTQGGNGARTAVRRPRRPLLAGLYAGIGAQQVRKAAPAGRQGGEFARSSVAAPAVPRSDAQRRRTSALGGQAPAP